jgi:hypothetical protein
MPTVIITIVVVELAGIIVVVTVVVAAVVVVIKQLKSISQSKLTSTDLISAIIDVSK